MIIALILLLLGFVLFFAIEISWPQANLIFGASVTDGKIISSGIETETRGEIRRFRPQITYQFNEQNIPYSGTVPLAFFTSDELQAQNLLSNYPIGCSVQVRYDSWKPTTSTLVRARFTLVEYLAIIARLLVLGGGIFMLRELILALVTSPGIY